MLKSTFFIFAMGLLVAVACDDSEDVGGDSGVPDSGMPSTNEEHEAMLGALGFDTELGSRSGPGGSVPPSHCPARCSKS